jgi:hypothetical protein
MDSRIRLAVILFAASASFSADPAVSNPVAGSTKIFGCSLGKKSVLVTSTGSLMTYRFGSSASVDITIVGSALRRNLYYRAARYAGMEYQLRFANGPYSYIVYSMEGNGNTGTNPVSGLVVMKGTKRIAEMSCVRHAEFSTGFDYDSLPEDDESFTAM